MTAAILLERTLAPQNDLDLVRDELARVGDWGSSEGMAGAELEGQLIRPMIALAGWQTLSHEKPPVEFWYGALAVQLVHEASLLHDDVIDGAARRRGAPTLAASRGTAAALVKGDHLLTTAYRYAARTRSAAFIEIFARSVERTVAGEIAQGKATGRFLSFEEYERIARGKSGELLGCALALAPTLLAPELTGLYHGVGSRIGLVYQMLDDLLDLCPATDTGKPALADYSQNHWTWPLSELAIDEFGIAPDTLMTSLYSENEIGAPIRRCMARYESEVQAVAGEVSAHMGASEILRNLLDDWVIRARKSVDCEARTFLRVLPSPSSALLERVQPATRETEYLAKHSLSFRLASRFFPRRDEERVARVYAWCRLTDDLVDEPSGDVRTSAELLEEWVGLSSRAYSGSSSGITFLDRVMGEMADSGVPFVYATDLVEGMRMDLRGTRYATMDELGIYTYRVASVVGLWITELFDVRDPVVLQKAAAMGHAMQLTNILRDVGEDLRLGRCYLPADMMERHRVTEGSLRFGNPPASYSMLMEELIESAESAYRAGFEGLSALPIRLRIPVSVAAHVYRGILREIRLIGYDNLTKRACTSAPRKAILATKGVLSLQ